MRRRLEQQRLMVVAPLLALLFLLGVASAYEVGIPASTLDTGGPDFIDLVNWYVDTTLITEPVEVHQTLRLLVLIWDEETIDVVIGCFKRTNETQWSNVTMSFQGSPQSDPHLQAFGANATQFTLSPSHPLEVWNVKYYAHDSLGRWNVSHVVNGSIRAQYGHLPTNDTTLLTEIVALSAGTIMISIVVAVIVVNRRKHV